MIFVYFFVKVVTIVWGEHFFLYLLGRYFSASSIIHFLIKKNKLVTENAMKLFSSENYNPTKWITE